MASGQTPQYLLNQWIASDQVLMEEFNADNLKLETALAGLASQTAAKAEADDLTALAEQVAAKAEASDLTTLSAQVAAKASSADLAALSSTVAAKADQTALTTLSNTVAAKADQTALTTLSNTVAGKADAAVLTSLSARTPRFTYGTYTGNGTETRAVSLGFTPKAVYVCTCSGSVFEASGFAYAYGGLALEGNPAYVSSGTKQYNTVEIITGGFQVSYKILNSEYIQILSNSNNQIYYYIALDYPG